MKIHSFRFIQIELTLVALMLMGIIGVLPLAPNVLTQVVDSVRGIIGPEPIALAENVYYGATDAFQQKTNTANTPGFWSPPALPSSAQPQVAPNLDAPPKILLPRAV